MSLVLCAALFVIVLGFVLRRSISERRRRKLAIALREQEAARAERARRGLLREKQKAELRKYQKIVDRMIEMQSVCLSSWDQVTRTAEALHGTSRLSFAGAVKHDVLQILSAVSVANGGVTKDLGRMYQAVSRGLSLGRSTLGVCISEIKDIESGEICLPVTIQVLTISDRLLSNGLASRAAAFYISLVNSAAAECDASFAVTAVKSAYETLLDPFLTVCDPETSASHSQRNSEEASSEAANASCTECAEAYKLLELPFGAGRDAVTNARRELAKSFHPDAFGNRRGVRMAETHLKMVNGACDHLLACSR